MNEQWCKSIIVLNIFIPFSERSFVFIFGIAKTNDWLTNWMIESDTFCQLLWYCDHTCVNLCRCWTRSDEMRNWNWNWNWNWSKWPMANRTPWHHDISQHHHHHLVLSSDVKRITHQLRKTELRHHQYEHNDKYIDWIQQKLTTKTLNYCRNGNNQEFDRTIWMLFQPFFKPISNRVFFLANHLSIFNITTEQWAVDTHTIAIVENIKLT